MKILHVIPSVAAIRGGPSKAILEMVKALIDKGIEAEIVTTNDNGPNLLNVPLKQRTEYKQVPIYFFPRFSPDVHPVREFAFSSELTAWLWQKIRNYDLLHIHAIFSYPSTVAMAIARQQRVNYIVRPLGQLCEWSLQQSALKKRIYLSVIEKANINSASILHLTSKLEQQELSRLNLNTQSFILPHGICIPPTINHARVRLREYLKVPADQPIILFLSRLHPKKGLDYLIPALGKLTHHRFTFVIAGSGSPDYEAEVKSLVTSHGIDNCTYIAGFVEGEFKNLLMQGADLFALTSHSENFGVAILEALAAGLPVLVTDGVALADLVQEKKLGYVTELDVNKIVSVLQHALKYPEEIKDISKRARQLISESYTWNQVASNLSSIYTNLTSS